MDNKLTAIIGKNVKKYRHNKGFSIEQLCGIAGINTKSLVKIENGYGNPQIATIEKISNALSIDPKILFDSEDNGPSEDIIQHSFKLSNPDLRPPFLMILSALDTISDKLNK